MDTLSLLVGISIGASLLCAALCLATRRTREALACMALVVILGAAYLWTTS